MFDSALVARLKRDYHDGSLSLFCGAGISATSKIPDWNSLLRYLLFKTFLKSDEVLNQSRTSTYFAETYAAMFPAPPLILAQHFKNQLRGDYLQFVKEALYMHSPTPNELIKSISELCLPTSGRMNIRSILTYNYDDLLEIALDSAGVKSIPIFHDGGKLDPSVLHIYHVHGYLPRGNAAGSNEIVLSEDSYHDQYFNPFKWSNVVHLSQLSQSCCLLIGISLTDPNMRRLLAAAKLNNPNPNPEHYIIKKKHTVEEMKSSKARIVFAESMWPKFLDITHRIEQEDANKLGLNVVWVDSYEEYPDVLRALK